MTTPLLGSKTAPAAHLQQFAFGAPLSLERFFTHKVVSMYLCTRAVCGPITASPWRHSHCVVIMAGKWCQLTSAVPTLVFQAVVVTPEDIRGSLSCFWASGVAM